jgi:hypothetical protein
MLPIVSNIRVFVHWSEQTVFAGEDIECQITFKNVAVASETPRSSHPSNLNGLVIGGARQRKTSPLQSTGVQGKNGAGEAFQIGVPNRGHRSTLSLNVPMTKEDPQRGNNFRSTETGDVALQGRSHRRSVSIVSLGRSEAIGEERLGKNSTVEGSRRPLRGHARASSLQIVPRRSVGSGASPQSGRYCYLSYE